MTGHEIAEAIRRAVKTSEENTTMSIALNLTGEGDVDKAMAAQVSTFAIMIHAALRLVAAELEGPPAPAAPPCGPEAQLLTVGRIADAARLVTASLNESVAIQRAKAGGPLNEHIEGAAHIVGEAMLGFASFIETGGGGS